MINLHSVQTAMRRAGLGRWAETLPTRYADALRAAHGNLGEWHATLRALPMLPSSRAALDKDAVTVGDAGTASAAKRTTIEVALKTLNPWRKGPFSVHGVDIDSEWRSNLKWDRLVPWVTPLKDRVILDVGSGNGYYGWRMAGQGAKLVIGIDPTWLYVVQFLALRHFIGETYPVHLLPFGIEHVPAGLRAFDTVFSMGVLYHRRSPFDHLLELRDCLKPGGELVLETLVIDGGPGEILLPEDRYAKMRNVWLIPSVPMLELWLKRCGYTDIRTVDVSVTTTEEQRSTEWMTFESLADFLDLSVPRRTIEGYPSPMRGVVIAKAP